MYTISKVSEGVILICQDCGHIERVTQFNVSFGSQRTQAARAMLAHVRERHKWGTTHASPEELWSDVAVAVVGFGWFSLLGRARTR
jgi:hypothetical protein